MRLVWTESARSDRHAIFDYISLKEGLKKSQKQKMSICERSEAIQQSVEMSGFSGLLRLRLADAILSWFELFRPSSRNLHHFFVLLKNGKKLA